MGFLTYGGMEIRSMEAMAVGLVESLDMEYISQGPEFIAYLVDELDKYGVPVIKPAGGLGAHLNCSEIVPEIPHNQYPAAAVGAALYIAGGIRGMERGTVSEQREPDGTERYAELELLRLALPRRVFTLSQVKYCADRVKWMYDNRNLIGGLKWVEEPKVLRFFFGRMTETVQGFYTREEMEHLVRYAADRQITVIPEIDMPGHMLAALASYPELGCTGGPYEVTGRFGVFADVLCPGKDATLDFARAVLKEVMEIFPSEYIHLGGDECPKERWKECLDCQARIRKLGLKDMPACSSAFPQRTVPLSAVRKSLEASRTFPTCATIPSVTRFGLQTARQGPSISATCKATFRRAIPFRSSTMAKACVSTVNGSASG